MRSPPSGGEFATMKTEDGTKIRYARWPGEEGKPTIVFLTGLRECIEKHFETIEDLQKRGLGVCAMDWRGQGLSTRPLENPQKLHIDDFDLHVGDLHQFITTIIKKKSSGPLYILAHSMGGHIALRYLHDVQQGVDGAILASPMCDIWTPPGLRFLFLSVTWMMTCLGFSRAYGMGGSDYGVREFGSNRLTSDQGRFAEFHQQIAAQPALKMGGPTWGWFRAAWTSVRTLKDEGYLKAIGVPIYAIQAGIDGVVSNRAQNWVFSRLNSAHLFSIEGARHELLGESDEYRDQFWALFDRFLEGCA